MLAVNAVLDDAVVLRVREDGLIEHSHVEHLGRQKMPDDKNQDNGEHHRRRDDMVPLEFAALAVGRLAAVLDGVLRLALKDRAFLRFFLLVAHALTSFRECGCYLLFLMTVSNASTSFGSKMMPALSLRYASERDRDHGFL